MIPRAIGLALFSAALCLAQGPRILIVTDLEGVGGVNNPDEQLLPGQRRFMESRRLLIGETNAAVEGAFAAGASEVVIWDGHDGSRTLSIDEIDSRAQLLQDGRRRPITIFRKSSMTAFSSSASTPWPGRRTPCSPIRKASG